jgi:hypothetical protein
MTTGQHGGGRSCSAQIHGSDSSGSWRFVKLWGGSTFGGSGPRRPAWLVTAVLVGRVGLAGMRRVVMVVLLLAMVGILEVGGVNDACGSLGIGVGYVWQSR